jgi:predicted RNA binding protein YcfA (HicA-like mRNA interferase family)
VKLPRDLPAWKVINALKRLGFWVEKQEGSDVRLFNGKVRVAVPNHPSLALGTLKSILRQAGITLEQLLAAL